MSEIITEYRNENTKNIDLLPSVEIVKKINEEDKQVAIAVENETENIAKAIDVIAKEALKRKTGARALRSIVENLMLDVMYEIPSDSSIKEFTITADMVKTPENLLSLVHSDKKDDNKVELKKVEKIEDIA